MRLLIALIVWTGAVVGAVALSSTVAHTVHDEQVKATKAATTGSSPSRPAFQPDNIKAADRRSLLVGSNFARVLALVRRHVGADANVEMIEIFPGQLEMTVRRPSEELSISARIDGEYLSSSDSNVSGSTQVFSLSQINSRVPGALLRRIAAHGHVPLSQIKFVNVRIDPTAHQYHWYVYPTRDSVYFRADDAKGPILEYGHGRPRVLAG